MIRKFRITAADGKTYDTMHYNLSTIIAVGYKVNSERAVQFRKWATRVLEEFTIKGFATDDERLARGGSVLSDRYFEEQLERVRDSRLSERRFYQKITDIYATATREHMGLHRWGEAPSWKVQKFDVVVAKNYLIEHELLQLSRLVNAYLDVAEET